MKNLIWTLLAVIAGYAIMVTGLFISQDLAFGGIEIGKTKEWELAIAGLGAIVSAFAGGYLAEWISPLKKLIAPSILAFETIVEATYLYLEGAFPNPLWFDVLSEMTLLIGIIGGGYYYFYWKQRKDKLYYSQS